MKILIILDVLRYGGAQKIAINLGNALSEYGHSVSLYCYAGITGETNIQTSLRIIDGTPFSQNHLSRHLLKICEIRKTLKKERPNVAIAFMTYPSILTVVAALGLNTKVIVCERGDPNSYGKFVQHIGYRIFNLADGAVFQTEEARNYFHGRINSKSIVIPNPVTIRPKDRIVLSQRYNRIAFVGRFDIRQKRQDIMVKSFVKIHALFPDIMLVFYGDGQDMEYVKEMVHENNLDSSVIFAGKIDSVIEELRYSRLFVLSSDFEGIPNALIEAMSAGVPCISTDCTPGGARLLIKNRVNGLLVNRGSIDEIANACIEVINDPDKSEEYGRRAQEICNDYAPERIFAVWARYISEVAGK